MSITLSRTIKQVPAQVTCMSASWSLFSNLHNIDRTPEGYISSGSVEGDGYA